MNTVSLIGRLTKDIDLRYTDNGKAVGSFGLAVDGYKDHTNFFEVQVWGKQAENAAKYIGKGRLVGVTGELKQDRWEKDGNKRSRVIVNARNIKFLDYEDDNMATKDTSNKQESDVEIDEEGFDVPF